mmetsp:Transcript_60230/g.111664  ORF Transcript_60230/g.111664 Transcript_60230/m.111664 type:complete len:682 (+) Transcript_60230:90-2135(+)
MEDARGAGFFRELENLDVHEIQDYLTAHEQPFEASEVHMVEEGRNVIDLERRNSSFRRLKEDSLFNLIEPVVAQLSQMDPLLTYKLVRSDITHIKYAKGGFFAKHSDYLSVTSNMIEEFALLVCVTPAEQASHVSGGKTVLYLGNSRHVSDSTTRPGCAIAFRKDVEHESTVLEAGEKHIIMANLWAWRKCGDGVKSDVSVLLVTFPGCDSDAKLLDGDSRRRQVNLDKVAAERTYAIPLDEAKHSPALAEVIAETCGSDLSGTRGPALLHECRECTFEEFSTIFRILRRMRVTPHELQQRHSIIRRYGLETQAAVHGLQPEEIPSEPAEKLYMMSIYMVDGSVYEFRVAASDSIHSVRAQLQERSGKEGLRLVMVEGGAEVLQDSKTLEDCGCPKELNAVKVRLKVDEYHALGLTQDEMHELVEAPPQVGLEDRGSDVIVCSSVARTEVVAAVAKAVGLPFVVFQALCFEGTVDIGGDTCRPGNYTMDMHPALICLGDCRQVLEWWRLHWWEHNAAHQWEEKADRLFDLSMALRGHEELAALSPGLIASAEEGRWGGRDSDEDDDDGHDLPADPRLNLDHVQRALSWDDEKAEGDVSELFHVNAAGQSCFNKAEAAATVAHLKRIGFTGQIVNRLSQVPFELPQHSDERHTTFCNEQVYGNVNILLVSGVVRLLPDEDEK